MDKNLRWRTLAILAVVGLSIWGFYPPAKKVRRGLDIQGGVHLVLRVHTDDALKLETETTMERFRELLEEQGITPAGIEADGADRFKVRGVPAGQDAQFRAAANEIQTSYNRDSGSGGEYTFSLKPNLVAQLRDETVDQALQSIERRVNELGVAEPIVARSGAGGDQIIVQLPGIAEPERAKAIISSTALLELKLVEDGPASTREALLQSRNGMVPSNMEVVPGTSDAVAPGERPETVYYLVRKVASVTGRDLRTAKPSRDELNRPAVSFSLNQEGARKFARATGENIGRRLAIVLDGRVQSAPVIEGRIFDEGRISGGSFTQQEVQDLSLVLRSGALPASLTYLEERTVGPSLGADSIRAGVIAALGGLALVVLFLLLYYRLSGVNAIVSMVINLLVLLGMMAYLDATMTLPGVAGFILTIGMGVDSNVLIFERIKEELAAQRGVKQAIGAAFDRVFLTILDTHVASLISAAFLFQFGTGPIRGFATTLSIGLLSNVFTSVFVSRTVFDLVLSRRRVASLSI
ncbi:MAG TPA: protein translocase subunit SecD [Vicinamibacterales bacterium]|nr:protein translocase subunit SecD [Vicinamibacterales bacterium]HPW20253.1 protein translocase subunit SecD [Vicinamibacterales bacterium]